MSSLVSQGYGSDSEEEEAVVEDKVDQVDKKREMRDSKSSNMVKNGRVQIVLEPRKPLKEEDEEGGREKKSTAGSECKSLSSLLPAPRRATGNGGGLKEEPSKSSQPLKGRPSQLVPRAVGKASSTQAPAFAKQTSTASPPPPNLKRRTPEGIDEEEFFSVEAKTPRRSLFHQPTKTSRSMSGSEDPLSSSTEKEKGKGELALDETGLAPSGTNAAPTVEDDTHDQDQGNEQPVFEELLDDEAIQVLLGRRKKREGVRSKGEAGHASPLPKTPLVAQTITQEDQAKDRQNFLHKAATSQTGGGSNLAAPSAPWRASSFQRRTGNLKGLAERSEAMDAELQERWAKGKRAKEAARNRYGF
ncbi:MAG: hypothetical protein DHS80DRAFT_21290 [Piptocephalis tieghemiana]|nr:MAG: hypothetical protein DHS80DRAFT_21290 [Piptocephalis tieghemiana]